ncbi:MAG TPA: c-type cytochrome [Flavipsychrobacter sp.]|nr:c-type cytochrome [Flavipsychrobacter sp.]
MKKLLLFIVWMCFNLLSLHAQRFNKSIPSTTKIYNEEGKVQMLIAYNPACSCKTYSEFYSDGKLYAKRMFKLTDKGEVVDGEDVTYLRDGSIKIYKLWQDALPVGRFYFNHDNGNLEHEEFYEGRYKTGTWKYFDEFGKLLREKVYEPNKTLWNSKKDDAVYKYYQNGTVARTEKLTAGTQKIDGKKVAVPGSVAVTTTDGKKLYELKCKTCHAFDANGYGPSLTSFSKNRSKEWLVKWITDAQKLVDIGDADALELYKKWNNKRHPSQSLLTRQQVQAIIGYLKL